MAWLHMVSSHHMLDGGSDMEGYEVNDPKHPDYHSTHSDIWDARDKTRPKFRMYLAVLSEPETFDSKEQAQRVYDKYAEAICNNENLTIEICEAHEVG